MKPAGLMTRTLAAAGLFALSGALGVNAAERSVPGNLERWSLGASLLYVEGGEVPARIHGGNPDNVAVTRGDDTRTGLRLAGIWQWRPAWSVEIAWVGLGNADARLGGRGATAAEVLEAGEDLHPQSAYGLSLGLLRHWDTGTPIDLSAGAGAWAWRAEWDISVDGRTRDYHRTGTDLYASVAATAPVGESLRLGARWDRYMLEAGEVDSFGLELLYRFD